MNWRLLRQTVVTVAAAGALVPGSTDHRNGPHRGSVLLWQESVEVVADCKSRPATIVDVASGAGTFDEFEEVVVASGTVLVDGSPAAVTTR